MKNELSNVLWPLGLMFVGCCVTQTYELCTADEKKESVAVDSTAAEPELLVEKHSTGFVPYRNTLELDGSPDNEIEVNTARNSSNYVVLVKRDGDLVANVYISSGSSYTIHLPDGTYRVYFYAGGDWSPDVVQKNGRKGGFINGRFTKDDNPLELYGARMIYTLYAVENGNFSPDDSNAAEAL